MENVVRFSCIVCVFCAWEKFLDVCYVRGKEELMHCQLGANNQPPQNALRATLWLFHGRLQGQTVQAPRWSFIYNFSCAFHSSSSAEETHCLSVKGTLVITLLKLRCVLAQFSDLLVEEVLIRTIVFLEGVKCGRVIFVHVNVVDVRMWLEGRIEKQC